MFLVDTNIVSARIRPRPHLPLPSSPPDQPDRSSARISGIEAIAAADANLDLSRVHPRVRSSLHDLKIFWLSTGSLNELWDLEEEPGAADVIVVTCDSGDLSADLLDFMDAWLQRGKGLLFDRSSVEAGVQRFFPAGYHVRFVPGSRLAPVPGTALTENVERLAEPFWCASTNYSIGVHEGSASQAQGLDTDGLGRLLKGRDFVPILIHLYPPYQPPVLFGTSYGKGRIAWFSGDIERRPFLDCSQSADDVRLWSNVIHWLAKAN